MEATCGGSGMSENKTPTDGGAAFPLFAATGHSGMTLRDYFAGKAMQALAQGNYFDATARQAYMIADAMLKARER